MLFNCMQHQIKKILFLCLLLCGCSVSGNYAYEKDNNNVRHRNEWVFTYNGQLNNMDYKVKNKVNFDKLVPDKPAYYETSYEIWFW